MSNLDDHDNEFVVSNFIDNAVDSLTDPIAFLRGQFYAPLSTRVVAQGFKSPQYTSNILLRNASEILRDRLFETSS